MDFTSPVSEFMTTKLWTIAPHEPISRVKEMFDKHHIHHIPVVKEKTLVGMISKLDYARYTQDNQPNACEVLVENSCSPPPRAADVMTKHLATLEPSDRINVALDVFAENLFHSIPIVDNGELVGILTTLDIINVLMEEDRGQNASIIITFSCCMNIEVYSVKGFTANLLKTKLQEAFDKNKITCSICLINNVDRFLEAGLSSVPALRIGNKIIENITEMELDEMIRKAVDFILEEERRK